MVKPGGKLTKWANGITSQKTSTFYWNTCMKESPIFLAARYYKMGYRSTSRGDFTAKECVVHPDMATHNPTRVKLIGEDAVRLVRNMEKNATKRNRKTI